LSVWLFFGETTPNCMAEDQQQTVKDAVTEEGTDDAEAVETAETPTTEVEEMMKKAKERRAQEAAEAGEAPSDEAAPEPDAEDTPAAEDTDEGGAEVATAEAEEEEEEHPDPLDVRSILEEAVSGVTDHADIPSANPDEIVIAGRRDLVTSLDEASETTFERDGVGFSGKIVGRVITLDELEADEAAEQSSADYDQLMSLIDQTLTDVTEQEIVTGRIVSVGEKDIVIDIGFKSDGVVPRNEFGEDAKLVPGQEVDVFLERIEDRHGQLVLSKEKADSVRRWQKVEEAYENGEIVEGTIIRRIKGGMIVDLIDGLEAFLPGSQIDVRPVRDFDAYLEKRMEFKIVKINPSNENVVISHKALIQKELEAQRDKILSSMEVGQVLEGTVKNIVDFGVFIDLGGVDGLLHITDLSWGRVSHPSELVDLDEKIKVVVLDYDKERQRISLGLKQLQPHPWENIDEKFEQGDTVEGKVVSITDYGAFVELEKGIEGLVHISEMSWTDHIRHPSQKVSLGQLVNVKILNIDHEGKKISLGMKQLEDNPWVGLSDRYPPGTVLRGTVRNITNFGVFVQIEPGIDGLVHISDLSWTKKIRHPSEVAQKGQEMDVVILNIDEDRERVSLGHKQVSTNPWDQFAEAYAEGSDHEVEVTRVENKGLIVELPLGAEAFVPGSELKNGPQNFQSHYHEGQELELRVIRFDKDEKEIILSETASERAEEYAKRREEERERRQERQERQREVQDYQKKTEPRSGSRSGGPTTLGELSGLADLKQQMEAAEAAEVAEAEVVDEEPVADEAAEAPTDASAEEAASDDTDDTEEKTS